MQVSIVGAGLSGLTLAAALTADGIECQVFEQAPALGEVGAGIQIAPNASRLLHRLGLQARLRAVAVRPAAIEMRRWDDNQLLARTALGAQCEELFGAPYYTMHRADLHSALLSLLPADTVRLGMRCVAVEQTGDGVLLHFAGGSTQRCDVVAGADGIHSQVRDSLVRDAPQPSGQTIYRGLAPADRLEFLLAEPKVILWLGPGRHCVCYPISAGRMISFAATAPADGWHTESWSARGHVEDLLAAYRGWHPQALRVISAADAVSRWALHDRDPVPRWSSGRVTLVGDAAHAMLPFLAQGANQAVEDAIALAGVLRTRGHGDIAAALRHYQDLRLPRTAQIQRLSRANSATMHLRDSDEQRTRDASIGATQNLRAKDWLYGYDADSAA